MKILWNHFARMVIFVIILLFAACVDSPLLIFETTGAKRPRPLAIVTFETSLEVGNYTARNQMGISVPLQVDQDGKAMMLVMNVSPEVVLQWTVRSIDEEVLTATSQQVENRILFRVDDREVAAYHFSKGQMPHTDIPEIYHRDGYLHPVWTPGGQIITDDYPQDHVHHHGIWAAWTKTIFQGRNPDFWNMGQGTGRVEVRSLDSVWSGSVYAGIQSSHRYVDMVGEEEITALHESWHMNVYSNSTEFNILDLVLVQTAATDSALILSEHRYGGVGFRGHRDWNGKVSTEFFTSEGHTRESGHATRARWCHIGGLIDGEYAGIAVLGHPDNHEAPQPMRIHPTEPFFNFAPSQVGSFTITPDKPFVWKYRFVTYDGYLDRDLLDALWEDYANPLDVQILHELPSLNLFLSI
ncbi:MAG: PmoA family protein [Bacteroidetes bacterium]|nr:PmoA family protein [Bacteroidota bacterium]MCY4204102.1 PmoA family protein [Bacteroidota bacterium]